MPIFQNQRNQKRIHACKMKFHSLLDGLAKIDDLKKTIQTKSQSRQRNIKKKSLNAREYNKKTNSRHIQIQKEKMKDQKKSITIQLPPTILHIAKKQIKPVYNHFADPVHESQRFIEKYQKRMPRSKIQRNSTSPLSSLSVQFNNSRHSIYNKKHQRQKNARQFVKDKFKLLQQKRESQVCNMLYHKQESMKLIKKNRNQKWKQIKKNQCIKNKINFERKKLIATKNEESTLKIEQMATQNEQRVLMNHSLIQQKLRQKIRKSNDYRCWRVDKNKQLQRLKYKTSADQISHKWRDNYIQRQKSKAQQIVDRSNFFKHQIQLNQRIGLYESWLDELTSKAQILQREEAKTLSTNISWLKSQSNKKNYKKI